MENAKTVSAQNIGRLNLWILPFERINKKVGAQNFVHLPFLDIRILSTQKHVFYDGIFKIGRADQNIGHLPFFGY